jgi:hypothetical protein
VRAGRGGEGEDDRAHEPAPIERRREHCGAELHALKQRKDLEVGDANSGRLSLDPLGDPRDAARVTVPLTTAEGVDADDLREQLTATSVGRLSDNSSG